MASHNWWGNETGTTAEDNPGGIGEPINGSVIYRPYYTTYLVTSAIHLPIVVK